MTLPQPTVSVIIPTYNRCGVLRDTLHSLSRQTYPVDLIEVIVVSDGCTDDTASIVEDCRVPYSMRLIEQPNQGAAAARNQGAREARGELFIFLDDDIEAVPQLVEAHVRIHQIGSGRVALGYIPASLPGKNDFFESKLRGWWEAMFQNMRKPGHRFLYTDLLSGNFSIEAQFFARVRGFDPQYWCHEDYELGFRLLRAGAIFSFAERALGYHHEFTDLNRALRRKYQEGIADVMLGQAHPELRPTLLLARLRRYALLPSRILALLAFKWPATGDHVVAILQRSLAFLEKWKMRHLWQRILDGLLGYWYWKGVARELKTFKQTDAFLKPTLPYTQRNESLMKLDLSQGLDEAERLLDAHRPAGAQIYYRTQHIGLIPPTPGAERLRGIHLRPCLATALMAPLLRALTLEGGFISTDMNEKVIAACDEKIKYQKLNESRYA